MKILLVRVSSLGDVLHNMPIVDDLRRQFPQARIDWVVEEAYVQLVRLNPGVDQVFPFALRRWRKSLGKKATRDEIGAFFKTLRSDLVVSLYNQPAIWPKFGYEGSSAEHGGYIARGFDDIDWLQSV